MEIMMLNSVKLVSQNSCPREPDNLPKIVRNLKRSSLYRFSRASLHTKQVTGHRRWKDYTQNAQHVSLF